MSFKSSSSNFAIVNNKKAAPILLSADDWLGVQLAAANFAADIERVTSITPSLSNFTVAATPAASASATSNSTEATPSSATDSKVLASVSSNSTDATPSAASVSKPPTTPPIIIGTLGQSSLINAVVKNAGIDTSSIEGKWEAFLTKVVKNPLPGVSSAYVIIGSDKRGTIFALYDHSEQFGEFDKNIPPPFLQK